MLINGVVLKKKTLWLLGIIASGTLTVQTEWVKDHIIPLLANHPHLSTLGAGLLMALSLIHNPIAQQFFSSNQKLQAAPGDPVIGLVAGSANKMNTTAKDPQAAMGGKLLAVMVFMGCVCLTGCPAQNTIGSWITIIGATATGLAQANGNSAAAAKLQADFQLASQQALAWKQGNPDQDVIQALQLVQADLSVFDVNGTDAIYVATILGGIEGVLELLPSGMDESRDVLQAHASAPARAAMQRQGIVTPKSASAYKAQWNAQLLARPKPGLLPLK